MTLIFNSSPSGAQISFLEARGWSFTESKVPPVDAAANQALVEFLAVKLDCSRGKVELLRGQTSRHKTILLHGFKPDEVLRLLL